MVGLLVNVIQNTTIAALIGVSEILETANRQFENVTFGLTGTATAPDHAVFMIYGFVLLRLLRDLVPAHAARAVSRAASRVIRR